MKPNLSWGMAAAALCLAVPVGAQGIPTRTLSKPDAEYSEPFTQITGIRELRDGRVIVADQRDKIVQVVDLRSGKAEAVGREGSGPGEYAMPSQLFALPGDSSAVLDPLNRRMLVITPAAKPAGFLDLNPAPTGGARDGRGGGPPVFAGLNVTAVDARGRLYMQGPPIRMVDGTPQASDSVAIERMDRSSRQRDTVAFLQLPRGSTQISSSGGRTMMRVGPPGAFPEQDQYAVAPDGRVALIHVNPFSVEYIAANGSRVKGQPIRYDRVRVTEGHKQQWREDQRATPGMMVSNRDGRQTAQMMTNQNVQDPAEWPEFLPPFLRSAARFAPDGTLWLRRTTPADEPPTYDLIDGNGRVVQRVLLPKRSRLVGFGSGTVYVARADEDDLQYLVRYRFAMADRP